MIEKLKRFFKSKKEKPKEEELRTEFPDDLSYSGGYPDIFCRYMNTEYPAKMRKLKKLETKEKKKQEKKERKKNQEIIKLSVLNKEINHWPDEPKHSITTEVIIDDLKVNVIKKPKGFRKKQLSKKKRKELRTKEEKKK